MSPRTLDDQEAYSSYIRYLIVAKSAICVVNPALGR